MRIYEGACKRFSLMQSQKKSITISCDLPEHLQRIILTHEVSPSVLHRNMTGIKAFHDFALFDDTSLYEYEANIFAAEWLTPPADLHRLRLVLCRHTQKSTVYLRSFFLLRRCIYSVVAVDGILNILFNSAFMSLRLSSKNIPKSF